MHAGPNEHIVSELSGSTPGNALDAGCGRGLDAIWLSKQGWRVTAVDISELALNQAKSLAEAAGVSVDFERVDLTAWLPPKNHFDLVLSHHVHTTDDRSYVSRISRAVKPGGILMIIGHQPPGHGEKDLYAQGSHITVKEISSFLDSDDWEIEIAEARKVTSKSSDHHHSLSNSVLKARRRKL
jgi:2-polyprenyl-3-methyl-5-hydroxy-6-metoxy-1,4-benzoquinol methylase